MKLALRIMLPPGVVLALLIGFAVLAVLALRADQATLDNIQNQRFASYQSSAEIAAKVGSVHIDSLRLISWVSVYDEQTVNKRWEVIKRNLKDLDAQLKILSEKAVSPEEQRVLNGLGSLLQKYGKKINDSIDLATADANSGLAMLQGADSLFSEVKTRLDQLTELENKLAQNQYSEAQAQSSRFQRHALVLIVVAIVASLAISRWTLRRILRDLGGEPELARQVSRRIASGDLTGNIEAAAGDTDSVLAAMQEMQNALGRILGDAQRVTAAGMVGDFSQRVPTAGLAGFGLELATNLNQLLQTTESSINDVRRVMMAVADGDLSQTITQNYSGAFGELQRSVNISVTNLAELLAELRDVTAAANDGFLDRRLATTGRVGYQLELAEQVNALVATCNEVLSTLSHGLHDLAGGNLQPRLDFRASGMFGEARDDFNRSLDKLEQILGGIRSVSDVIANAAKEIAAGNLDLSTRTEHSANSLEKTASSMEAQTTEIQRTAENARSASDLAKSAAAVAVQGGQMVDQVVANMGSIAESSMRIREIIGVIDGIAFQTNILALNAAVEAARAGEQGRGFAVVATEVRNLAKRSADAAKEIKNLIQDSVNQVHAGHKLVEQTGETMVNMVSSVQKVTDVISEIASSSQEQSAGIEQVNHAIALMERGLQENSALVEQASAAAYSLEEQANMLAQIVGSFQLSGQAPSVKVKPRSTLARPALPKLS